MRKRASRHNRTEPIQGTSLSSHDYIVVELRDELDSPGGKIQIRKPENCLHGQTICSDWKCVESWSIDYRLHFDRTVGGRRLAAELGIPESTDVIGTPEKYISKEEFLDTLDMLS